VVVTIVQQLIKARCLLKGINEDAALQQLSGVKTLRSSRLLRFARHGRAGATVLFAGSWAAEAVGVVEALGRKEISTPLPNNAADLLELTAISSLRQIGKKREFTTDELTDALVCNPVTNAVIPVQGATSGSWAVAWCALML
jgi:hypothetical protein